MIWCVGVGPGHLDFLTRRGEKLLSEADVIAGFNAVMDIVRPLLTPDQQVVTMGYKDQVAQLAEVARRHHAGAKCVVVGMGDLHFSGFQLLGRVEVACGHPVETIPGISSAQMLASKGRVCFDDTTFFTFHRRGDLTRFQVHLCEVLSAGRNAIVIPRPWDFMPKDIATYLLRHGIHPEHQTEVWENLSRNEAAWQGHLSALTTQEFSDMSILLIRTREVTLTGLEHSGVTSC